MNVKKIIYCGFYYEYGIKENGLSTNYESWFKGFKSLGYKLYSVFYDQKNPEEIGNLLIKKAEKIKPDIIFVIPQANQIKSEVFSYLKLRGNKLVAFFGDDQWRYDSFSKYRASNFDICITTDKFSLRKYFKDGYKNIFYSQWASLPCNKKITKLSYKYDISFFGSISPYRKWVIKYLASKKLNVICFGKGWTNGRISYKEIEELIRSTKINLNISNSTSFDIRSLTYSPTSLLNIFRNKIFKMEKTSSQIKARNFEIPAFGGFQLTDYVPTLENYFDIGSEIVCYRDIGDIVNQLEYYLENEVEREKIRINGVKRARLFHSYEKRIEDIINYVERTF